MDITNTTALPTPPLPFEHIKNTILGHSYELSIVLIDNIRAQELSGTYKNKAYDANVLSFPLSQNTGEIFLNLEQARNEAVSFEHAQDEHVAFLLIHGCLHLHGLEHGDEMEAAEDKYMVEFGY